MCRSSTAPNSARTSKGVAPGLAFRVPTALQVVNALCPGTPFQTGALIGSIEISDDTAPVRHAKVVAEWFEGVGQVGNDQHVAEEGFDHRAQRVVAADDRERAGRRGCRRLASAR